MKEVNKTTSTISPHEKKEGGNPLAPLETADLSRNAVIRRFSDIPRKKRRKLILGWLMTFLFPRRAGMLQANQITEYKGKFDRTLRNGLTARAFLRNDHASLRSLFAQYWAMEADSGAEVWQNRFEDDFLAHNVVLIDALEAAMQEHPYQHLYELGSGHGQVLEYLADRLNGIEQFVGVDISEEQTEKNRKRVSNPALSFVADDAVEWVINEAQANCIVLTNGGVFEYFLQEELERLFGYIAAGLGPSILGIIETIGADHDLESEYDSMVYGRELAFSHNYPHLMKQAGFELIHISEQAGASSHGGGRWIRVLGIRK